MRDLLRNSTLYTLLGFLPTAINFLMVPLLTSYLTKSEYGLLSVSNIFQGIIAVFINIGLDAAFARYYFNVYKKKKLLHAYYSTVLISILGLMAVFFTIFWFSGDLFLGVLFKNTRFHFMDYGIITFFLSLSTILYTVILSYYRNEENLKMYALLSITLLSLTVAGVLIGVVWCGKGAFGSMSGRMIAVGLVVVVYLIAYFRNKPLIVKWKYLKGMLRYGVPFVPYLLLLMANSSLDQWMMERRFSLNELGEYNFAFQLASLVSVFIYAVFNAISPRLYKLMSEDDPIHDTEILNLNRVFHFLVVFAVVGELAIISPVTTLLIHNVSYHAMLSYIPLLIISWLPHLYYMLYVIPIMFYNRTNYLPFITGISLLVGLAANMLLIPLLGIIGICVSAMIIKMTSFILTFLVSRHERIIHSGHYRLGKNHVMALLVFSSGIGIYLWNDATGQQYRPFLNLVPLLVFLIYCMAAFRKELNIVLTLFLKRKNKHE